MDTLVKTGDVLLGKYRVERVLGKGGMGLVVAARHLQLGELFAIKFLLPSTPEQPQLVERFVREARAAARLRGDHVARVHDVGRTEAGAPYMVLEYLQGSDLRELVREKGPLPVEDAALFVLQACDAIAEAHAAGIVHRDLKPANLFLIRRPNGSPSIKVLDFGVSKQTGVDEVELTTTGAMLGSPMYMAPEQVACSKSADARTDIWAMGVVLYELVTGRRPFDAETVLKVVALVLQAEPALPSELRPDLPRSVEEVILRCMRKRPEERFQSIGELAAALREALSPAAFAAFAGATIAHPPRPRAASTPDATTVSVPSLALEQASAAPPGPSSTMATLSIEVPAAPVAAAPESAPAVIELITTVHEPTPTLRAPTHEAPGTSGAAPAPRRKATAAMAVGAAVGLVVLGGGAWWLVRGRSSGSAAAPASAAPAAVAPGGAAAPAEAAEAEVPSEAAPRVEEAAPAGAAAPAPPVSSTAAAAASAASQQGPAPSSAKAAPGAAPAPSARPRAPGSTTERPTLW
ncbi:serine/threonine-protein kinase [Sorangium sp. So ce204]|uniref:serine/threonine-protein kinase n=1 Tax=Sorangium sp. So ce204 TaxID=3133288 RepID=UPI003F5ECB1E